MQIILPENVSYIIRRLNEAGYEAYAVGGCIRDSILGREPQDWDITTSALPEQTKSLFGRTVDTGIVHGTVTVMLGREGYEVTTYRIDGCYSDSRHPDSVSFTRSLSEDLKRRDFTINAMACCDSEPVDLFGGINDLNKGIIRCVGDPNLRFSEDALRILRAVRFSAQLGFEIESATASAATVLAPSLVNISAERIHAELNKLLLSNHPDRLLRLKELGIARYILPELNIPDSELNELVDILLHSPADRYIRWALMLLYTGISGDTSLQDCIISAKKVMRRLKFDNLTLHHVSELIRLSRTDIKNIDAEGIRRLMNDAGTDNMEMFFSFRRALHSSQELDEAYEIYHSVLRAGDCTEIKELAVNGQDLLALGVPGGKQIGQILDCLLDRVLTDPDLNRRDILLTICREELMIPNEE